MPVETHPSSALTAEDAERLENLLSEFSTARFAAIDDDGKFIELRDDDPRLHEHYFYDRARWIGGRSDAEIVRCVLAIVRPIVDRLTAVIAERDAEIERQEELIDDLSMSWNYLCRRVDSLASAAREAEKVLCNTVDMGVTNKLLVEVYHQAWHVMESSCEYADTGKIDIDPTEAQNLCKALEAYEDAFPDKIHGEPGWDDCAEDTNLSKALASLRAALPPEPQDAQKAEETP